MPKNQNFLVNLYWPFENQTMSCVNTANIYICLNNNNVNAALKKREEKRESKKEMWREREMFFNKIC